MVILGVRNDKLLHGTSVSFPCTHNHVNTHITSNIQPIRHRENHTGCFCVCVSVLYVCICNKVGVLFSELR